MTLTTNLPASNCKVGAKVVVLVLGMHRSGTSLLGGILEQLGCQGAQTKMVANQWNAKGYFESPEIMKLNDDILSVLGSSWDGWSPLHTGWHRSPRFSKFRTRITEVMAAEYGSASLIYLKDPRICRLLPLWREALTEAGYSLACIHTHRNPMDVTRSLQVRIGFEVEQGMGMLLWLRHILDAEAGSRGLPRIFTSYTRILSNWTEFSDQAERTFGFSWPLVVQSRDARVQEIIDPVLRHHDTPIDAFLSDSAAPELAKDCLRVLEAWAEKGEDEVGRETLALVHEQFDKTATLFVRPLAELATKCQQMSSLESDHMAAQKAAKQHEIDAAMLRDDLETQQRKAEEIQKMLKAEVQELTRLVTDQKLELEELSRKHDDLRVQGTSLSQELQLTKDRLAQQRAEADIRLSELQADLNTVSASLQNRQAHLDALQEERNTLNKQETLLRKELRQAKEQLAQVREEAEAQQAKLQAELNTCANKVIERDQIAAAYIIEIENLHQEYRSSTSWKCSAPIRVLGRLLKGKGV